MDRAFNKLAGLMQNLGHLRDKCGVCSGIADRHVFAHTEPWQADG
jgi:hypothetical protein